jgi:predicted metalloprotease with PDZ domain
MRRFTAFAALGFFIAAAPAFAQQAGTNSGEHKVKIEKERRVHIERRAPLTGCGFLGIYPNNIGPKSAERLGIADRRGAIVADIVNETGASRAGIQKNDVIVSFNDTPVTGEYQLRELIIKQNPGTWVRIELIRNGQTITYNAEITSRSRYYPGAPDCSPAPTQEPLENQQRIERQRRDAVRDLELSELDVRGFEDELMDAEKELDLARRELRLSIAGVREQRNMVGGYEGNTGLGLQKLSDQLAQYFRTGSTSGALVNEVAERSPAERAGMQAGDVIVAVNGKSVSGPMDAVKAIVEDQDGTVDIRVVRGGQEQNVQINTGAAGSGSVAPAEAPELLPEIG